MVDADDGWNPVANTISVILLGSVYDDVSDVMVNSDPEMEARRPLWTLIRPERT